MSTIDCSGCLIPLTIPPGARSIRCSVCQSITQLPTFASFGLTPSTQAPPYSQVFGLTPSDPPLNQAPPYQNTSASFGLTTSASFPSPASSFNYVAPQSEFGGLTPSQPLSQAPPSQNSSVSSGLTPSTSFNYVKPQSGFGRLTSSGSFNYVAPQSGFGGLRPSGSFNQQQQQQQQPVYPSLTPSPSFSYGAPGRKKALIVGVSYKNTRHELRGCINDAKYMKHLLITKFHFREDQIVMLTEEEIDPSRIPTGRNIRQAMAWLSEGCQQGDSLVFHFSGHGSRQRNYNGDEMDGYDETLCPLDFETEGMIVDDEINAKLVNPIPYGVKLHAIIDSCHSGTVLDLPNLCRMKSSGEYKWEDHSPKSGIWKGSSGGEVISISGCDDDQTSADTSALSKITSTGAMTFIFIEAIEHGNASTYGHLLSSMRKAITDAARRGTRGLTQEPQLSSWEQFDMYSKPFSL